MNKIIKFGLIGAGAWGENYIHTIEKIKQVELTCIYSNNLNIHKIYSHKYKIYKNWRKLISEGIFDGLIIATPTDSHINIMEYCINLKIPILVEKPLTKYIYEAEKILDTAKNRGAIVLIDHIHLYNPSFKKLKEIYPKYGNIHSINSLAGGRGPYRKDTRALWDWGSHDAAMSIDILNEIPELIQASYLSRNFDEEKSGEIIKAHLISKNNIEINLIFGNLMQKKTKIFELHQNNSLLRYQPLSSKNLIREVFENNNKVFSEELVTEKNTPLSELIKEFRLAILKNQTNLYDLELAVKATILLNNISIALEQKT